MHIVYEEIPHHIDWQIRQSRRTIKMLLIELLPERVVNSEDVIRFIEENVTKVLSNRSTVVALDFLLKIGLVNRM